MIPKGLTKITCIIDGADEDAAQTTDQIQQQDAAVRLNPQQGHLTTTAKYV